FIATNPQFSAATFNNNMGHNNYHSVQAQYTLRPTHGVSYQGTFTWSKNMGLPGTFTNPVDRHADYTLVGGNRKLEFRQNGSFELAIGPNKLLLPNSSGWLARGLERWQLGWIFNMASGAPSSITTNSFLYANGTPDLVGPFPFDSRDLQWGNVTVATTRQKNGSMFDPTAFAFIKDPQCATVAAQLQSLCTLQALTDAKTGQVLLQNPLPGKRGTLGQNVITGIPDFRLDANLSKTFRV